MKAESKSKRSLYLAVHTSNILGLALGTGITWSSPIIPKLNDKTVFAHNPFGRVISEKEESWIGSLLCLGGVFGCFIAGYAADKIGRKRTLLIFCGFPLAVSYFMLAFSQQIYLYYLARFIAGIAGGGTLTVLPMYIGEVAENSNRGELATSITVFLTLGQLVSYALGPYISIFYFCIILAIIPIIFIITFCLFAPESPYYLMSVNKPDEAKESLNRLRSKLIVEKELEIIGTTVEESMSNKASICDVLNSRATKKALITTLSLMLFQQFSGISAVLVYAQSIFIATGSSIPSDLSSIALGTVQVIASGLTPFVVDKTGRRFMLLLSAAGLIVSLIPLGAYFYLQESNYDVDTIYWLPIASLILFMAAYNIGFASLPWTIMAEIFAPNIKSVASTITAATAWFLAFLMAKFFKSFTEAIGMAGSFWFFAACCVLAIIFIYMYLIETKGKTFVEIQELLNKK